MSQNTSQKNKLTDAFGRQHDYLRISLTEKCNLRCSYCMPEEGIPLGDSSRIMHKEEVLALAKIFLDFGIKKIRLTGGEPLVCRDAAYIISKLAELPVELAMTTNGLLAGKFIPVFKNAGLRHINISLDSLKKEKFSLISRRPCFGQVISNIRLLIREGFHPKINTVVIRHLNDDEILDFVEWTRVQPVHIRFIEYMPFDGNHWQQDKVISHKEILEKIEQAYHIEKLHDAPNSTSKSYRIRGHPGTFALISTVSAPFCSSCNRLRLTADGKLRNCLFASNEYDLLSPYRKGKDIRPIIKNAVLNKAEQRGGLPVFHKEQPVPGQLPGRCMVQIGG